MKKLIFLIMTGIVCLLTGCVYSVENLPSLEEQKDIMEYELNLPEEYYIEVDVIRNSGFGKQKTTYCISESADGWIYMKLGSKREQYVYKPVSEGKYIEYKYDENKKQYKATMISDALQKQIDKGNVSIDSVTTSEESVNAKRRTVENIIYQYSTLTAALKYIGDEEINGRTCCKYSGTIKVPSTTSKLMYLIDPETGVVMKSTNSTKAFIISTKETTECVVFELVAQIPKIE